MTDNSDENNLLYWKLIETVNYFHKKLHLRSLTLNTSMEYQKLNVF